MPDQDRCSRAAIAMIVTALTMVLTPGLNMIYLASRSIDQASNAPSPPREQTGSSYALKWLAVHFVC